MVHLLSPCRYEAAIPEVCNGTAITIVDLDPTTNPMTCDLNPATDGTAVCPDGCNHYMAVPGIPSVEEACTPFSEVSAHSPSGTPSRSPLPSCFLSGGFYIDRGRSRCCSVGCNTGAYVSTTAATEWTLASLYVADAAKLNVRTPLQPAARACAGACAHPRRCVAANRSSGTAPRHALA